MKPAFQDSQSIRLGIGVSREGAGRLGSGFCHFFIGAGMDIIL